MASIGDGDGGDSPLLSDDDEEPEPEPEQEQEPVRNAPSDDEEGEGDAGGEGEGDGGAEVEAEAEGDAAEEDEDQMDSSRQEQPIVDMNRVQEAMTQFTPDQLNRYEHYRRSGFSKNTMRKLVQSIAGCSVTVPMAIVMGGLAKMFVGDVVETARIIMSEQNEEGPIRPRYLRQAYRRLKLEGKLPVRSRPSLFH